jgi:hypothetical protein
MTAGQQRERQGGSPEDLIWCDAFETDSKAASFGAFLVLTLQRLTMGGQQECVTVQRDDQKGGV